ncbi:MAG: hypothetical protein CMJ78_27475 [Planctomycetaceae bacterium]|nr:hypothetical protein [Planctomycetaceae bacterium]
MQTFARRLLIPAAFSVLLTAAVAAAGPKYQFQSGQSLAYQIQVEIDREGYLEIMKGATHYTIKSSNADATEMGFSGGLSKSIKSKPGVIVRRRRPLGPSSAFSPFTGLRSTKSVIKVSPTGEAVSMTSTSQLPFLLGNLSQLPFVRLPTKEQRTWELKRNISIAEYSGRFPTLRPIGGSGSKNISQAEQTTTYTIKESTDDKITIEKTFKMATSETVDGKPKFEINGSGTIDFDPASGIVREVNFEEKLISRDGKNTSEVPLKLTIKALSKEQIAELEKQRAEAMARLKEAEAKRKANAAKPLTADEKATILKQLKADDFREVFKGLRALQSRNPQKHDEEIVAQLTTLKSHSKRAVSGMATRVLKKWSVKPKSEEKE